MGVRVLDLDLDVEVRIARFVIFLDFREPVDMTRVLVGAARVRSSLRERQRQSPEHVVVDETLDVASLDPPFYVSSRFRGHAISKPLELVPEGIRSCPARDETMVYGLVLDNVMPGEKHDALDKIGELNRHAPDRVAVTELQIIDKDAIVQSHELLIAGDSDDALDARKFSPVQLFEFGQKEIGATT